MPTYEYACDWCKIIFEVTGVPMAKSSDDMPCGKCGKPSRRIFSRGPGLIFKGTGFYETDYKKKT